MVRQDFFNGGFPISKRAPVLCIAEDGQVFVAYNRYILGLTIQNKTIKKCIGVWPGKLNTDCFPLDPDSYKGPLPPPEHLNIDDSSEISIVYHKGTEDFDTLYYKSEDSDGCSITIKSASKELLNYVRTVGLKYKVIYE